MADDPTRFRTLAAPFRYEPERIKGSRFVADAARIESATDGAAHVARIAAEFAGANHHCYAWVADAAGLETRVNDDGEPGSSAGAPILRQILGHDLRCVAVVVTRWFGGTKLGVGGLVRAYGGAAGQTLDRAPIVEVRVSTELRMTHPYACAGAVEALMAAFEARVLDADYGAEVTLRVSVPLERAAEFRTELVERTAGLARLDADA